MTAAAARRTPGPAFTVDQLLAIIGVCDLHMANSDGLAKDRSEAWRRAELKDFAHHLADVRHLAFGVIEGHEEAADLQAALEEIDFLPLWRATSDVGAGLGRAAA